MYNEMPRFENVTNLKKLTFLIDITSQEKMMKSQSTMTVLGLLCYLPVEWGWASSFTE